MSRGQTRALEGSANNTAASSSPMASQSISQWTHHGSYGRQGGAEETRERRRMPLPRQAGLTHNAAKEREEQ